MQKAPRCHLGWRMVLVSSRGEKGRPMERRGGWGHPLRGQTNRITPGNLIDALSSCSRIQIPNWFYPGVSSTWQCLHPKMPSSPSHRQVHSNITSHNATDSWKADSPFSRHWLTKVQGHSLLAKQPTTVRAQYSPKEDKCCCPPLMLFSLCREPCPLSHTWTPASSTDPGTEDSALLLPLLLGASCPQEVLLVHSCLTLGLY